MHKSVAHLSHIPFEYLLISLNCKWKNHLNLLGQTPLFLLLSRGPLPLSHLLHPPGPACAPASRRPISRHRPAAPQPAGPRKPISPNPRRPARLAPTGPTRLLHLTLAGSGDAPGAATAARANPTPHTLGVCAPPLDARHASLAHLPKIATVQ